MSVTESKYTFIEHKKPWKYEEDGLKVTRGSAWTGPGCHIGCGVLMYTDQDDNFVGIEGDPENPFNQGRLCPRCIDLDESVNNKTRLLYPMKRAKEDRGKNTWERISWDEALDLIAEKFIEIREKYGPETVAFMQGTGRDIAAWITRLCWSFGSPNYLFPMSGQSCYLPRVAGCAATTGNFWVGDYSQQLAQRYDDPTWKVPEYILVWGNNPIMSNSDGLYGHWVVDCMKRGSKLIVVDPRRTWLANKAEFHLQLRPGTDAALALGMLNVIIAEDLYDKEFVRDWTYGFDELAESVQEFTPEKVAEITWLPVEAIVESARAFARAENGIVQWGVAVDMVREALPAAQAISAIYQICGKVEKPGSMIVPPEILAYSGGWGRELVDPEVAEKRIGLDKYALLRYGFQVASTDEYVKTLETGEPYKMHGLWFQTTNFLTTTSPDPDRIYNGVKDLDFIATADLYMTPTIMAIADVVLPAKMYPERDGLRIGDGVQRAETINQVTQVGECKSDMEINLLLGKRFNPEAWPWDNTTDMFSSIVASTGYTFPELQEKAPGYMPFEYHRHEKGMLREDGQPGFNTETGRIELWSLFYANAGLSPLPFFEEPEPSPYSMPELAEKYPLILSTGARKWGMFHSENRQVPRLRSIDPDPVIQVHPDDLAARGLKDGDWVWVENHLGRAQRKVESTLIVRQGVCCSDHAWWYPEGDPEDLYGQKYLNINRLLEFKPGKSGFGSNYKTGICNIYKVKEGE